MVEAAEERKTAERHRWANIVAVAFNEPKRITRGSSGASKRRPQPESAAPQE